MPDKEHSDWADDVAAAVRRAAPEEPSSRDVELMASRAWRLAASRRRVEWLRAPGLLGSVVAVAIGIAAIAGAYSSRSMQVASEHDVPELTGALKFDAGGARSIPVEDAVEHLSYEPTMLAETAMTGRLEGATLSSLAVDTGADDGDLVLGLDYENVLFAQYEWDDTADARSNLEGLVSHPRFGRLYRQHTDGSLTAFVKDPANAADLTDGADSDVGGLVSQGSQVVWVDGRRFYSLSSSQLDSSQLLTLARSLSR